MSEAAGGEDAAVVELLGHDVGVDDGRQRQRRLRQAVFQLCYELRLPVQALDLPCAQGEGGDWDDCWKGKMREADDE